MSAVPAVEPLFDVPDHLTQFLAGLSRYPRSSDRAAWYVIGVLTSDVQSLARRDDLTPTMRETVRRMQAALAALDAHQQGATRP